MFTNKSISIYKVYSQKVLGFGCFLFEPGEEAGGGGGGGESASLEVTGPRACCGLLEEGATMA